jgi:putative ABC transport system ATP-binding protein
VPVAARNSDGMTSLLHRGRREAGSTPGAPAAPTPASASRAAAATDAVKTYGEGTAAVHALDGASVAFEAGMFTAIMGPSGSGKSTLMHCLAGLDRLDAGRVEIAGADLAGLSDAALTGLRRDRIGFVFQAFNLVPTLTAVENIVLPMRLAGRKPDPDWFAEVVSAVGLVDRLTHRPGELSGGQQQRVACARALLTRPDVVFADEPTGNLDSHASADVLSFMARSVREFRQTIVMVTHDPTAAAYADRVVFLADGHIVSDLAEPTVPSVLDTMRQLRS